jgi:hypothetical protein
MDDQSAENRAGHSFSGAEKAGGAFIALAVLLALIVPEDLYERSEALRAFVNWMAVRIPAVDEFAGVSDFPGATRVVVAVLWACVLPLAAFIWLVPGMIRWKEEALRRIGLMRLAALGVIAGAVIVPMAIHISPADLEGYSSTDIVTRLVSSSRIGLGIVGGLYCAATAFMLACVPRLLNPRYFW